jgi:hypothetical protein
MLTFINNRVPFLRWCIINWKAAMSLFCNNQLTFCLKTHQEFYTWYVFNIKGRGF